MVYFYAKWASLNQKPGHQSQFLFPLSTVNNQLQHI